jgi:hypothetical protein
MKHPNKIDNDMLKQDFKNVLKYLFYSNNYEKLFNNIHKSFLCQSLYKYLQSYKKYDTKNVIHTLKYILFNHTHFVSYQHCCKKSPYIKHKVKTK